MRTRLQSFWYVSAFVGLATFISPAAAVPPGPYNSAMSALAPVHWYQMDEDGFAAIGATAATLVNSGSSAIDGLYITNSGQTFASPAIAQGGDANTFAVIGRTVGPTKMSKFTNPEIQTSSIADQNPGLIPDYSDPADPFSVGFNRVFEPNLRAAIRLVNTTATNQYSGDATTGAITVAGWFRSDEANTTSTVRLFDTGEATGTQGFFQITTGGTQGLSIGVGSSNGGAADGSRTLRAYYPSGTPASSVGGDRGVGDSGQWYFIVASTFGSTNAERAANVQLWERYADKTNALQIPGSYGLVGLGGSNSNNGDLIGGFRQAHIGVRDTSSNLPTAGTELGGEVDEVAIWNRVLQYDERENLYISAVTPIAGAIANTTTADGNWAVGGNWSTGTWPLQHGANQAQYYAVVVDHNILATTFDNSANGTNTFRSNMASLAVNAGKTLTLDSGATLRTSADMTISGNVVMNGLGGVYSSTTGAKDNGVKRGAALDSGRDVNIAVGSSVTMASQANQIRAEGNITFSSGSYTLSAYDNTSAGYTTGAHLDTVVLTDYDAGSGSLLQDAGVMTGTFASHTIPGGGGPMGDPLGRRVSVLYENRSPSGVGAVDTMKIGFARGGDLDFDGDVDFSDAFTLTNNYGTPSGATWRSGDSDNNGTVDFNDAIELVANYGFTYATTPGAPGDGILTLMYDNTSGIVSIEGPPGEQFNTLSIISASGLLQPGVAGWLGLPAGQVTFTQDTAGQQGFGTLTAVGGTFLPQNGYVIGQILPASLSFDQLLQDLTISYSVQGQAGSRQGNLVPEPSSVVLLALGLIGLSIGTVARRRRTAKACNEV